jgi:hypothetical protein
MCLRSSEADYSSCLLLWCALDPGDYQDTTVISALLTTDKHTLPHVIDGLPTFRVGWMILHDPLCK